MKPGRGVMVAGWSIILLMPVLVFSGLEAAVRLLDIKPALHREAAIPAWLDRNILVKESRWIELLSESPRDLSNYYRTYRWDRHLFYSLQPNLDIPLTDITAPAAIRERTRWVFHTNSKGFNSREVPYEKPPGTFRIVALGDSSTFGWGVDTEKIYVHLLESSLRRRHPEATIQVVNLGVCGYSSLQGLILLRQEALRYQPDVLTLSYGSNDYSLVPEPFDVAYERNRGWSGALRKALSNSRAYQIYASFLTGRMSQRAGSPAAGQKAPGVLNVGPDKGRDNLVAMARVARSHGIDPIFITNCVPGDMSRPIRSAAAQAAVPLVDTQALLEGAIHRVMGGEISPEGRFYYRSLYGEAAIAKFPWLTVYLTDECHPNIIGHQILADALVPLIEATPAFQTYLSTRR